jgi:hypothetical protein
VEASSDLDKSASMTTIGLDSRKRKRNSIKLHKSCELPNQKTYYPCPAQSRNSQTAIVDNPARKVIRNRRQETWKTSPKKHLSNEMMWMNQSVHSIQIMVERFNEEIDLIRKKKARILEELKEEIVAAISQR